MAWWVRVWPGTEDECHTGSQDIWYMCAIIKTNSVTLIETLSILVWKCECFMYILYNNIIHNNIYIIILKAVIWKQHQMAMVRK